MPETTNGAPTSTPNPGRWAVSGTCTVPAAEMCAAVRGLTKQHAAYGGRLLPVLSHAKLDLVPSEAGLGPMLRLETTTLDVTMQWHVPVVETDGFCVLVPVRALAAALLLPDASREPWTITVSVDTREITIRVAGTSLNALAGPFYVGCAVSEWPDTEKGWAKRQDGASTRFTLSAHDFRRVAHQAPPFTCTEDSRPILAGVKLARGAAHPLAVATNGHRLLELRLEQSVVDTAGSEPPARDHYIILCEALAALSRAGSSRGRSVTVDVREHADGDCLRAVNGPLVVLARVVKGPYPEHSGIIPRGPAVQVTVRSAAPFRTAALRAFNTLTRLGTYSGDHARPVRLLCKDDRAELAALGRFEKGGELERMRLAYDLTAVIEPPEQEGTGFGLCLNSLYLQQALRVFGREAVTMRAHGVDKGLTLTAGPTTVVLMPMRPESVPDIGLWTGEPEPESAPVPPVVTAVPSESREFRTSVRIGLRAGNDSSAHDVLAALLSGRLLADFPQITSAEIGPITEREPGDEPVGVPA